MKTWNQLFLRHGWLLEEKSENRFDCKMETEENLTFLLKCLDKADVHYNFSGRELMVETNPIDEEHWIQSVDYKYRGVTGTYWCRPGVDQPQINQLDTYIAGVVRQLNRLHFYTSMSCDGHGKRTPFVYVEKDIAIDSLIEVLSAAGVKRTNYRENPNHYLVPFQMERAELLNVAEKLSLIEVEWVNKGYSYIEEQLFCMETESLLNIRGVSGEEQEIRQVVREKLTPFVDHITEDSNGNLLAVKICGSGYGPTILLNAHLDTVEEIEANRKIIKEGNIWSSSTGILGADDRAGVSILLVVAKHLSRSSFNGTIKFIFTVEEEIGLCGARNVDEYFLWDVDAAIVVDRRGTGDIVTSNRGRIPFCHQKYGEFIARVANNEGLEEWVCTAGGSSDTYIWATHGIQSVNLSAGYNYEHTESEILDIKACYRTVKLVIAVLDHGKELGRVLRDIKRVEQPINA